MNKIIKNSLILLGIILLAEQGFGQKRIIDSLKQVLKTEEEDTNKVSNLLYLSRILESKGQYKEACSFLGNALLIAEKINSKEEVASVYNNLGTANYFQGNVPNAVENFFKAIKIYEETKDTVGIVTAYNFLGETYEIIKEDSTALDIEKKTLQLALKIHYKFIIASAQNDIGRLYGKLGDTANALGMQLNAIKVFLELKDTINTSFMYRDIGTLYKMHKNYNEAYEYYLKALKYGSNFLKPSTYNELGDLFLRQNQFKSALEYGNNGLLFGRKIDSKDDIRQAAKTLSLIYEKMGNPLKALEFYKIYNALEDSIYGPVNMARLNKTALNYALLSEKAEQAQKDLQVEADKRKQTIITWSVIGGLLLVLIFSGFIFRSLRITRKQNVLIAQQKQLVEEKSKIVEEKNKDILDSITYAKRLQDAILPPLSVIKQYLPESFLFYKPKDIVAGDFYWMERSGNTILVAAADCTGHGVPGALVSVVCSNALNRTVKEFKITEPGKILDKVRELVLETFEKSESNVQDGMDISLCCINAKTMEVQWSGAYNSLWYIQNGEIHEVPADKQPIGKHDKPQPFNTHNLNLQKGDTLYLFTDGYADQFGGPKGKKFKYKQMEELLLANAAKPMQEQNNILESTLNDWRGSLEQVDDILIIGLRV